jgi:RNA polymerase sigma-70 factor (ECF subfamily)
MPGNAQPGPRLVDAQKASLMTDHEPGAAVKASVLHLPAVPSDEELVERIARGDRWAEEALYRRYVELVGATALRLLRNRAEAEDVVQETFLMVFQRLHQLRDTQALRSWLIRVTVSRVHRRFRWNRLRRLVGFGIEDEETLEHAASEAASAEDRAELALVDRALARLKEQDRTAWLLRHAVGCSLEEVAAASGCSLAAAKRRLHAADQAVTRYVRKGGGHG